MKTSADRGGCYILGVTNGLCEHSRACEHYDFFASTSRDKKFALRAASSLESATRKQRARFNLMRTKFVDASLSDSLSRSKQFQSTRKGNGNSMQSIRVVSQQRPSDPHTLPKGNAWPNPNWKLVWVQWKQLSPNPWGCNGNKHNSVFCKYLHAGDSNKETPRQENASVTLMTFSPFGTVTEKMWNFLLKKLTISILQLSSRPKYHRTK